MIVWGAIFTFLISILTYMFFPRSDVVQVEQPLAEPAVLAFVEQHQAAKNYMKYMMQISRGESGTDFIKIPPATSLVDYMPRGIIHQVGTGFGLPANYRYNSALACIGATGTLTSNCPAATSQFIVTMGRASEQTWWDLTQMRPDSWRRAILKLTRGSTECGTLFEKTLPGNVKNYFVDTSQRLVPVPAAITNYLGIDDDILFCITPFARPYAQGNLALHVDAINNTGTGNANNAAIFNFGTGTFTLTNNNIVSGVPYWKMSSSITMERTSGNLKTGPILISTTLRLATNAAGTAPIWHVGNKQLQYSKNNDDLNIRLMDGATPRGNLITLSNYFTKGTIRNTFNITYIEESATNTAEIWINGQKKLPEFSITAMAGNTIEFDADICGTDSCKFIHNIKIYDAVLSADDMMENFRLDRRRFGVYYDCATYKDCGVR
ncbi:MAG: hypothetical protein PHX68_01440 [Alphaproteobacteria bacterium]|nr:hypothetical protein [Alphaproteobacteria bacterium]